MRSFAFMLFLIFSVGCATTSSSSNLKQKNGNFDPNKATSSDYAPKSNWFDTDTNLDRIHPGRPVNMPNPSNPSSYPIVPWMPWSR